MPKARADLAQSQQEVQSLKIRLSSVQSDLETLAVGHSVEAGDLLTRVNVAEANVLRHREEADKLRSESSILADYENALRASNEQVESLRREITALNQRKQVAQSAKSAIYQVQGELSTEVATLQNALAAKEQERDDLFASATQQSEAYDALRVRYNGTLTQLQQQQARVDELAAANQRLQVTANQAPRMPSAEKENYEEEINEAARVLAEKEIAVGNLREQVVSLQKDLETSRKSAAAALAAQSEAVGALPNARAMLMEMQTLQAQVKRMEGQLARARAASAEEIAQLADQLSLVSQTNKSLSSANRSLLNTKSSEVGIVQDLLAEAHKELALLTGRLADADKIISYQESTVAELTGANTDLDETKEVLELQMGRVVAESDKAQSDLTAARVTLAEYEQRAGMLLAQSSSDGAEKKVLQKKIGELNMQVATLRDEQARLQSIERIATGQEQELAKLKLSLNNGDSLLARQNVTIAELTGVNEELSKEIAALQTQLARVSDQSGVAVSEIDTLQKQLDEQSALARRLTEQADADLLTKQSLETQLSDLNSELGETQARLVAATQSANANSTEATRETEAKSELMQQLALTQARLSALQDENNRLAGVDAAREMAEQRVVSLTAASEELVNERRELVQLRAENKELDNTMRALERDRSSRIARLQQDNAALGSRLQQAQGTLDQIASAARLINPGSGSTAPEIRGGNTRGLPASRPASAPREHIVVQGDSLSRISLRYYGTSNRWQDIYETNRDVLSRENVLRPGQRLKLP